MELRLGRTLVKSISRPVFSGVAPLRRASQEGMDRRLTKLREFAQCARSLLTKANKDGSTAISFANLHDSLIQNPDWTDNEISLALRRFPHLPQGTEEDRTLLRQAKASDLVVDPGTMTISPADLHEAENDIARTIKALTEIPRKSRVVRATAGGLDLHEAQQQAAENALCSGFSVATGGPGVGKTTILRTMVEQARAFGESVLLLAPTGIAAHRMGRACSHQAMTVHLALALLKTPYFQTDLIIVDEASMLDAETAARLLRRIDPTRTRLVIVGDADQLPSVGAGKVLEDLVHADGLGDRVVRLTKNFRQTSDNPLLQAAHDIIAGKMPDLEALDRAGRLKMIDADLDTLGQWLSYLVEFGFTTDCFKGHNLPQIPPDDILLLTNFNQAVTRLNLCFQEERNSSNRNQRCPWPEVDIWQDDLVIQLQNNRRLGVYNGERGEVESADPLIVNFGGGVKVTYSRRAAADLALGYFSTVHKAQGLEANGVGLILQPWDTRRVVYTAVSRAKDRRDSPSRILIAGSRDALQQAIDNTKEQNRLTRLRALLV